MKRIYFLLAVALTVVGASARTDVDFSSRLDDPNDPECNTITAENAWGWYNVFLQSYDVMDYAYLYIRYESTCSFNLILQNPNWQNAYSVVCTADATEGWIKVVPHAMDYYSCVVIQNREAGVITLHDLYFCTEDEFFNPAPEDLEAARENLLRIRARYEGLLPTFTPGVGYGCYPPELCQALADALAAAAAAQDGEGGTALTATELNALAQAIVDAYRAAVGAKKLYYPEDGYYRFVVARQFNEGSEEDEGGVTHPLKAMYSDNNGQNGWRTLEPDNPIFLWTMTRQADDTYLLANPSNRLTFTSAERCTDGTACISIDPLVQTPEGYDLSWELSTDQDYPLFNFRMSTDDADAYRYVHANWHDNGNGWGGPMTVWCNTAHESGASEWYLVPVGEEEALSILAANSYGRDFVLMLADAKEKTTLANDTYKEKLITEASQFSSPFSQNDLGSRDGGDLSAGVLIDGDPSTFWHSYWSGGNATNGDHYLQVEVSRDVAGELELVISRRQNIGSDHVTTWGIYGSDQPEGEKFDYQWIADVSTPYSEDVPSQAATFELSSGNGFRYLRFYAEATTSNRGYFHVSEFQLYITAPNPNNQAAHMGEVFTNLMSAIEAADAVDPNNVSKEDFENLKAAYEPFIDMFVDPTPLRDAIEKAQIALNLCVEGPDPGAWDFGATDDFIAQLEEAIEYDAAGAYTQEESDAYTAYLANAETILMAAANQITPILFYAIRFGSREKYEEEGWSTSNAENSELGPLFDTYLGTADWETLNPLSAGDVREGMGLFFTSDEDADIAFRFVPVGEEGIYAIQHQATGLYIQVHGRDSWVSLSLHPTLFTVSPIGRGEMTIHAVDYAGGDLSYLHAQLADHRLVSWHDHAVGSNSGLFIEELGSIAGVEPGTPVRDYKAGEVTTLCYPIAITPSTGRMFTVAGTYSAGDKLYVALDAAQGAKAGQPVVYIADGTYNAEAEDDIVRAALTVGSEIATEPLAGGALRGTYEEIDLSEEALVFAGGKCTWSTDSTSRVGANRAYVVPGAVQADAAATYSLVLEVDGEGTGVAAVLDRVARAGRLYNADGRLIKPEATLGDVNALPAGLYILNGVKILKK